VLNPEEGKELVAKVPGAEYMLVTADGKQIESAGWKNALLKEDKSTPATASATATNTASSPKTADKTWDPNYELAISLELATAEGMRVHRPFVAVWVVDADKKPVKQIALWYNKPRWLNEMPAWYAAFAESFSAGNPSFSSTTSATRSAGKYSLKWDGRDDKGNLVKQGNYTIFIEAAREHGGYHLMEQAITATKAQKFELSGNTEVAAASLEIRKKTDGNN